MREKVKALFTLRPAFLLLIDGHFAVVPDIRLSWKEKD
jgi:hypothetical protein